jgi:DNA-binding transcriptional LysR family regulator
MNLHDLNLFAKVARTGSLTKAARSLSTVQSNVTARVRLLEEELGVQLVNRHHHGISLTRKGQEFLPYAQQINALVQKARETVARQGEVQGVLRIGSLHTTASARLPALLKEYVQRYQVVDLAVETGNTRDLIESVLKHRVDGAFVAGPVEHPELECVPAFVEELVLITPLPYRTIRQYLELGPVAKLFVFKAGCSYRYKLEQYLSQHGIALLNEMEFGTVEGIIGCVSAGLGISLLPRSVVERASRYHPVRAHRVAAEAGRAETLFITRKSSVRSEALERFIELVVAQRGKRDDPQRGSRPAAARVSPHYLNPERGS